MNGCFPNSGLTAARIATCGSGCTGNGRAVPLSGFRAGNWITSIGKAVSPNNAGGVENCVEISQAEHRGAWNDANENQIRNGVVEVPGKTNEKSLTENEKALIGTWYASGDHEHPCWIAGTENKLFQIYDGRATRLIFTVEGPLFLANGIRGEIVKDRILWSNGTWWSRKPAEYQASEKTLDADMPKPSSGSTTD